MTSDDPKGKGKKRQSEDIEPQLDSPEPTTSNIVQGSDATQNGKDLKLRHRRQRMKALIKHVQPGLVLENSGSVARDHLASERTFLAYVRTSLGVAGAGVALVQLFSVSSHTSPTNNTTFSSASDRAREMARSLGAATISLGFVVLVIGVTRFFTIQHALTEGRFPAARLVIVGITLLLGALVLVAFGMLVSNKF